MLKSAHIQCMHTQIHVGHYMYTTTGPATGKSTLGVEGYHDCKKGEGK